MSWFKPIAQFFQPKVKSKLPFPKLPENDYFNTVVAHCSVCESPIYGGQAIQFGPSFKDGVKENGIQDIRCSDHFKVIEDEFSSVRKYK